MNSGTYNSGRDLASLRCILFCVACHLLKHFAVVCVCIRYASFCCHSRYSRRHSLRWRHAAFVIVGYAGVVPLPSFFPFFPCHRRRLCWGSCCCHPCRGCPTHILLTFLCRPWPSHGGQWILPSSSLCWVASSYDSHNCDVLAPAWSQKPGQAEQKKPGQAGPELWPETAFGPAWILGKPKPLAWAVVFVTEIVYAKSSLYWHKYFLLGVNLVCYQHSLLSY